MPVLSPLAAGLLLPGLLGSHGSLLCLAGGPYLTGCTGSSVTVQLDGSASRDPSGKPISYEWVADCPGALFDNPRLPRPRLTLPSTPGCAAACQVELRVDNRAGKTDDCAASVLVVDATPPVVSGPAGAPLELWPPDHRMACFSLDDFPGLRATDDCTGPAPLQLAGCSVDEPARADACRVSDDAAQVCLRVERNGGGRGRTYSILVRAEDDCGNVSAPAEGVRIVVPHDQRRLAR